MEKGRLSFQKLVLSSYNLVDSVHLYVGIFQMNRINFLGWMTDHA